MERNHMRRETRHCPARRLQGVWAIGHSAYNVRPTMKKAPDALGAKRVRAPVMDQSCAPAGPARPLRPPTRLRAAGTVWLRLPGLAGGTAAASL